MTTKFSLAEKIKNIRGILFDINGTLLVRSSDLPFQENATRRVLELLHRNEPSELDWEKIAGRLGDYRKWAQEKRLQLTEFEIWTQWLLPDYPPELFTEGIAEELTLMWSDRKGRKCPVPGATQALQELKNRGFRLGVISNTISTLEIPRRLEEYGWKEFFDVVMLSASIKIRKPSPFIFQSAAGLLNLSPVECAYIGNKPLVDMIGCRTAGYSLGILFDDKRGLQKDQLNLENRSEIVINSLLDLLKIFPERILQE